jgi:hypothetical protein
MPSYTWSVKIETVGGQIVFTPDQTGPDQKPAAPGAPLTAQIGDIVSWRNDTGDAHTIWQTDGAGAPVATVTASGRGIPPSFDGLMSNPIAPDASSSPQYVVYAADEVTTIHYCCLLHRNETGSINITVFK